MKETTGTTIADVTENLPDAILGKVLFLLDLTIFV